MTAAPDPASNRRRAPRPLASYLAAALSSAQAAAALSVRADHPSFPWRPERASAGRALGRALRAWSPTERARAVTAVAIDALESALDGVDAYLAAPPVRRDDRGVAIWRAGAAALWDVAPGSDGMAVVVAPSIVNRPDVLDLIPERSLVRALAGAGFRPMLLDWGAPGPAERGFALGDYVERRLTPALEIAGLASGRPAALVGHCLGGLLALAAAQRAPASVDRLAMIAAPWRSNWRDREDRIAPPPRESLETLLTLCDAAFGAAPIDLFNQLFFQIDPTQLLRKFQGVADRAPESLEQRLFVALEEWVNGGRPVATAAARDVLIGLGHDDMAAAGAWRVGGAIIRPEAVRAPTLVATSRSDAITPYESAAPVAERLPRGRVLRPRAGHVGMLVGGRAEAELWRPLMAWLQEEA